MPDKQMDDAITDVVKKKRKRPDISELQTPQTEPGEIARMLHQAMTISHWSPINTDDPVQVAERIDQYHSFCFEQDMKPDMTGLALALGVDRTTLWRWENGDIKKSQAVRNALKKGREINEFMMVQFMQNGKLNPVTAIFLLKNNFGYRDQTDVVITPNNPVDGRDASEVRSQYMQAIPDKTED